MLTRPPLDHILSTIVAHLHPKHVLLFGSYAVGLTGPDSDVDLLIEMESEAPPPMRAMAVDALFGLRDWAMDVFVYTPAEIANLRDQVGTIVYTAEHEGRVLYQAA
jgi:predicted nucleotidyltransferase